MSQGNIEFIINVSELVGFVGFELYCRHVSNYISGKKLKAKQTFSLKVHCNIPGFFLPVYRLHIVVHFNPL